MRRRTFAGAGLTAGLLGSRASHAKDVRYIYAYFSPGGPTDAAARAVRDALGRNPTLDMQFVVENHPIGQGPSFKQIRPGSLHVVTGQTLRRLQRDTPYQFRDYFRPLLSLGRDVSLLLSSPRLGVKSLDELRRVRGTVRVISAGSIVRNGDSLRHLAAQIVAVQLLREARIEYVEVKSFFYGLKNNEVDLIVTSLNEVPQLQGAAPLMASRSVPQDDLGWSMAPLARYVDPLPVEDEYFLCIDRGWSAEETMRISRAVVVEYPGIRTTLRSLMPGIQPSSLSAAEAQAHLDAYFYGRRMTTIKTDLYLECGKAFPCETSRLDQRLVGTLSANRNGTKPLNECVFGTPRKTLPSTDGVPDNPCIDPTKIMGSNKPPIEAPPTPPQPKKDEQEKPMTWADKMELHNKETKAAIEGDMKTLEAAENKRLGPEQPAPKTTPQSEPKQDPPIKPKTR